MVILIGLFSGFLATFLMDAFAIFGIRTGVYNLKGLQVVPPLLGRSLSLIFRRRQIFFADIQQEPPQQYEHQIGMIAHYVIGLVFGVIFVVSVYLKLPNSHPVISGIIFGFLTIIFPWLLMYPAMGFGFFGRKLAICKQLILFSPINHLIYGLFLGIFANLIKTLDMTLL